VWREGADAAFVVDPGFDVAGVIRTLAKEKLHLAAILNTHGHLDHVVGNGPLKERYPDVPIWIGVDDAPMLTDPELNLSAGYGFPLTSPPADRLLADGETIAPAGVRLRVATIPGHSPGHVVFIAEDESPPVVFGGDVLFAGSIGRTDFPNGSMESLLEGIRNNLYSLPDATFVYPGHGPRTTVGVEKRTNPYARA
jgi:glyoxylase-like metal-dependent hydrolase (beta-lactamase superfamily II)